MSTDLIALGFTQAEKEVGRSSAEFLARVNDVVRDYGWDRRYRVKFLASTTDHRSLIVTYKGIKYNVSHDYPTQTWHAEVMH